VLEPAHLLNYESDYSGHTLEKQRRVFIINELIFLTKLDENKNESKVKVVMKMSI
jgi:hypothetical protein